MLTFLDAITKYHEGYQKGFLSGLKAGNGHKGSIAGAAKGYELEMGKKSQRRQKLYQRS